jgi:hypothetical protein
MLSRQSSGSCDSCCRRPDTYGNPSGPYRREPRSTLPFWTSTCGWNRSPGKCVHRKEEKKAMRRRAAYGKKVIDSELKKGSYCGFHRFCKAGAPIQPNLAQICSREACDLSPRRHHEPNPSLSESSNMRRWRGSVLKGSSDPFAYNMALLRA